MDDVDISIKSDSGISVLQDGQDITLPEIEVPADDIIDEIEKIHVSVDIFDMLRLYLIGFAVIMILVIVSSGMVMRLKTREILSK
mgnify:CR=1 FL=1